MRKSNKHQNRKKGKPTLPWESKHGSPGETVGGGEIQADGRRRVGDSQAVNRKHRGFMK